MDGEDQEEGRGVVAIMDSLMVGFQKWEDPWPVQSRRWGW